MTFGEMRAWTNRFKNILEVGGELKDNRLSSLMTDLETAYNIPFLNDDEYNKRNPFVVKLYRAVSEARGL